MKIKRGVQLDVLIDLTPDEWTAVYPHTSIRAEALQGSLRYPLTVAVDTAAHTFRVTGDTSGWVEAPFQFDVLVVKDGSERRIPPESNLSGEIIVGITA